MSLTVLLPKVVPPIEDVSGFRNVSILHISCGEKFYIAKTANVSWMIDEIRSVYRKYLDKGVLETNLFYPLVKYMYSKTIDTIRIEVLFISTDGYKVLKFELEQLEQHFGTKNCLNLNNVPHIPKTKLAKKGSNWLTQNEALNFRKLLTKYNY